MDSAIEHSENVILRKKVVNVIIDSFNELTDTDFESISKGSIYEVPLDNVVDESFFQTQPSTGKSLKDWFDEYMISGLKAVGIEIDIASLANDNRDYNCETLGELADCYVRAIM